MSISSICHTQEVPIVFRMVAHVSQLMLVLRAELEIMLINHYYDPDTSFDATIVRITTNSGLEGWGESTPFGSNYIASHALGCLQDWTLPWKHHAAHGGRMPHSVAGPMSQW